MRRRIAAALAALAVGFGVSCGGEERGGPPSRTPTPEEADDPTLTEEAARIVAFLRGAAPLDTALLADSVVFRVADEGGGAERVVARADLSDRGEWTVAGFMLAPPASLSELTLRPGSHFNCLQTELASRFTGLETLPHVGARMRPPQGTGCLQTWNVTLLFRDGRLTVVAYDQWEW